MNITVQICGSALVYQSSNNELSNWILIIDIHHNFSLKSLGVSNKSDRNEPPFCSPIKLIDQLNLPVINSCNGCITPNTNPKFIGPPLSQFSNKSCRLVDLTYLMLQKEPACVSLLQIIRIHFEPSLNSDQVSSVVHLDRRFGKSYFPYELPPVKKSPLKRHVERVIVICTCRCSASCDLTHIHLKNV